MTKQRSPEELRRRIVIADALISMVKKDPELLCDMRQPEALKHYNAQKLKLEMELYEQVPPEPVVVSLQTASLAAKSKM